MNSAQMKGNWQRLVGKGKEYAAGVRQRATAALRVGDRTCSPPLCAGLGALRSRARRWRGSRAAVSSSPRSEPKEQASRAVDGSGEGQVELECEAVENSMGDLPSGAALIGGHILGRDGRSRPEACSIRS